MAEKRQNVMKTVKNVQTGL